MEVEESGASSDPESASLCGPAQYLLDGTPDLFYESERLKTFKGLWPHFAPISAERLAKAGFFYTNVGDNVKCFCCKVEISSWKYGDSAASKHRLYMPNCDFILGSDVGNVPLLKTSNRSIVKFQNAGGYELATASSLETLPITSQCHEHTIPVTELEFYDETGMQVEKNVHESKVNAQKADEQFHVDEQNDFSVQTTEMSPENEQAALPVNTPKVEQAASFSTENGMHVLNCEHPNMETTNLNRCCGVSSTASGCTSPELQKVTPCDLLFLHGHIPGGNCHSQQPVSVSSSYENFAAIKNGDHSMYSNKPLDTVGRFTGPPPNVSLHQSNQGSVCVDLPQQEAKALSEGERLKFEDERLKSYVKWSVHFMKPEQLAKAGFYYTGSGDRVKCIFCSGMLQGWEKCDIPLEEHVKHFPHCGFVRGQPVGNVPSVRASEQVPSANQFSQR